MSGRPVLAAILVLLAGLTGVAVQAMPDPPGPSTVVVARSDHILVPPGLLVPKVLYPRGRVDFRIVEQLVDTTVATLTGKTGSEAWRDFVEPTDTVGILVDTGTNPVQLATVEVIIDRLVGAGVSPNNICVFSDNESQLFAAGFALRREGPGVRTYGADSEGFRGGLSRIVVDYCHALINVASLKADPEIGMAGAVANCLACVPNVERRQLLSNPVRLAAPAAHPGVRQKLKLNFLEAYLPLVDATDPDDPTWQYRGLLASTDPVALDVIGTRVLQGCRDAVHKASWPLQPAVTYLAPARKDFRLGQSDPALITVRFSGPEEGSFLQ